MSAACAQLIDFPRERAHGVDAPRSESPRGATCVPAAPFGGPRLAPRL